MQTNIPSNLQANIEQVRPAPDKWYNKYYIEAITFNVNNKDNHLWNGMITVLIANFARVSATQTNFWCKLWEAKRHKVMPTMQQTRRNR